MHRAAEERAPRQSDALIVKSYARSTSEMQLGALIGGGFAVGEESKTR
jgi:hypothetical protein